MSINHFFKFFLLAGFYFILRTVFASQFENCYKFLSIENLKDEFNDWSTVFDSNMFKITNKNIFNCYIVEYSAFIQSLNKNLLQYYQTEKTLSDTDIQTEQDLHSAQKNISVSIEQVSKLISNNMFNNQSLNEIFNIIIADDDNFSIIKKFPDLLASSSSLIEINFGTDEDWIFLKLSVDRNIVYGIAHFLQRL